jgi:hypothetical protein
MRYEIDERLANRPGVPRREGEFRPPTGFVNDSTDALNIALALAAVPRYQQTVFDALGAP